MKRTLKCPPGFVCADNSTMFYWCVLIAAIAIAVGLNLNTHMFSRNTPSSFTHSSPSSSPPPPVQPQIYVVQRDIQHTVRPDIYPEPVRRYSTGLEQMRSRGNGGSYEQVGILTAEGGSTSSASPDRTILPLFGRELDPRRSKWNYFTRTDGSNPVQVPVRYRNRICDDDTNGCDEVSSDDTIHVPALGRAFHATVYRKSF
jgi:hypothetical protein